VDSGLDENHSAARQHCAGIRGAGCSQLGVLVTSVSLKVLSDGDGLLDEVVEVLGDGGAETCMLASGTGHFGAGSARLTVGLQDSENLVTGDELDLGDAVRVSEDDADLGRGETSSGELEDLVGDLLRGGLGPRRLGSSVRESRGAHALSFAVHSGGQTWWVCCMRTRRTVPFLRSIR